MAYFAARPVYFLKRNFHSGAAPGIVDLNDGAMELRWSDGADRHPTGLFLAWLCNATRQIQWAIEYH